MKTDLFDFDLPESAIALRPASPRDNARLLQVKSGAVSDHHVFDLPDLLQSGDILVINETKVLPAALTAIRPARGSGGASDVTVDVNLHKLVSDKEWYAFVRPAKRIRVGDQLIFADNLSADVIERLDGGNARLTFSLSGETLIAAIEAIGSPPLPPYIARKRAPDVQDTMDYQTIYAREQGSVAAPTAGLHFTPKLFEELKAKGIEIEKLTLHVGAGTFLPVKSDDTRDHVMHSEWRVITEDLAERLNTAKVEGRRIIAVGTTALRALESAANDGILQAQAGETDIFITPGYGFQIVDGLMTNFHLPRSTLFMLVSALAGLEVMQAAYAHALETGYRFYSYGDTSLLWRA